MSLGQANRTSPIRNSFALKYGFMKNNNYKIFILYNYDYEIKYFSNSQNTCVRENVDKYTSSNLRTNSDPNCYVNFDKNKMY